MFVLSVVQTLSQNGIKFLHMFILWVKGLLNVRIVKKQITAKESSGIIMVRNSQKVRLVSTSRIFLSIARAMVYQPLGCISSTAVVPLLYLITPLGVHQLRFCNDDIHGFAEIFVVGGGISLISVLFHFTI